MSEEIREGYRRVTEILTPFNGLHNVNPEILAYACDRGTRVHTICEGIMRGFGEHGVDQDAWGYVGSFKKWWGDGRDVVDLEKRFYCDNHMITGQVDIIMQEEEGVAIIDLKTSSKESPTWSAQGSAYAYLAKLSGYNVTKLQFLHLNKHGHEPVVIDYPVDDSFFLAILRVVEHFKLLRK